MANTRIHASLLRETAELILALHRVSNGVRHLSPGLSDQAIESYIGGAQSETSDQYSTLTNRGKDVLGLVTNGFTSSRIGKKLRFSNDA